jgi:hypothetical protein
MGKIARLRIIKCTVTVILDALSTNDAGSLSLTDSNHPTLQDLRRIKRPDTHCLKTMVVRSSETMGFRSILPAL